MKARGTLLGVWLAMAMCSVGAARWPAPAYADDGIQGLRLALARYDLTGEGTFQTLRKLGELAAQQPGAGGDELRFLRVAAATDLAILGYAGDDAALLERVAGALDLRVDALPEQLSAELNRLARGQFRPAVLEALEALSRMREVPSAAWREPAAASAAKRDLIFLRAVSARIGDASRDVTAALAEMSADPCGASCDAPYSAFDATGRRAVRTLAEAGRALTRLNGAAVDGDPFASALGSRLADVEAALRSCVLRPMPRIDENASVTVGSSANALAPDVVLFTGVQGVRVGFVPSVNLAADGSLAMRVLNEPALPDTAVLPLPAKLPPFYLVPLPAVTQRLREALAARPELRVAVAPAPGTDAELLSRVLVSVRRVGCEQASLLGRAEHGATSAVQLSLLSKLEADAAVPASLKVRVHPASYDLRIGGRDVDPGSLEAQRVSMADVSFIPQASSEGLARALFRVAPAVPALRLLLPPSALDQSTEFKRSLREHPRVFSGT